MKAVQFINESGDVPDWMLHLKKVRGCWLDVSLNVHCSWCVECVLQLIVV